MAASRDRGVHSQNAVKSKKHIKSKFVFDKKIFVRGLAILLALLMLLSGAAFTIQLFRLSASAAENEETDGGAGSGEEGNVESSASSVKYYYTEDKSDILIAVGLMYADGVTVGFETKAAHGFIAGAVGLDRHFTQLYIINDDCVSVVCDANLSKSGMTYFVASGSEACAVGGYHLQTAASADAENAAATAGYNCFPAYIAGQTVTRIGQFASQAQAEAAASVLASYGLNATVAAPSLTGVSVVDPQTDKILYEYDCGDASSLGFKAVQQGSAVTYLVTPAKNTYSGVFKYSRYRAGNIDGVALTNILPLEEYVKGVLPYEIGNLWPEETMKAFAVAIRSYALISRKHETFDLCNSSCCQVFKGYNRATEAVGKAVADTAGLVLSYDAKIACTYYSSSAGGTTVSASDAWGSSAAKYPYLRAVVTPWEKYGSYPHALWTIEYTSAQLLAMLNAAGYNTLSGGIKSVTVQGFAENSSYVKSILVTDIKGVSIQITRSDRIRSVLGLNSANFVVGRAGENAIVTDYTLEGGGIETIFTSASASAAETGGTGVYALSEGSASPSVISGEAIALTGELGMTVKDSIDGLLAMTAEGIAELDMTAGSIPAINLPDLTATNVKKTERVVNLTGEGGSFVFYGRGWGHGVGISQYGAKDLAELGYKYGAILAAYFPGTTLTDYKTLIKQ